MKKVYLFLAILCPFMLNAQTWQWSNHIGGTGNDYARIIGIDRSHNIYLWGRYAIDYGFPSLIGHDCYINNDTLFGQDASFIAKYNEAGSLIWVQNVAPIPPYSGFANVLGMEYDSISNALYIFGWYSDSLSYAGCQISGDSYELFLSKLDADGNCVWSKNLGQGLGLTALTVDPSGNIFLAGRAYPPFNTIDTCHFDSGVFIAKLNSEGTSLWAKTKVATWDCDFEIVRIKFINHSIFAFVRMCPAANTLTIDTVTIPLPCSGCTGIVLFGMDTNSIAKWVRADGFTSSSIQSQCVDVSNAGNSYVYAFMGDTCILGEDTIINQGERSVVVKYSQEGSLLGYNKINALSGSDPLPFTDWGIAVYQDGSYYITGSFIDIAVFGEDTIVTEKPNLFLAHFTDAGECLGVDHVDRSMGSSIVVDESGVYLSGVFPTHWYPPDTGSVSIGSNTYESYGFEDVILAKHDLMTGLPKTKGDNGNNSLIIYANPNKGSFRVKLPEEFLHEKNLTLVIYDNQGKAIKSQSLSLTDEHPRLDIFGQKAGIYLVTISNGKKVYSGKLVVQ